MGSEMCIRDSAQRDMDRARHLVAIERLALAVLLDHRQLAQLHALEGGEASGAIGAQPAATTRGFGEGEFRQVGEMIAEVLDGLAANGENNHAVEAAVRRKVSALCGRFPVYPG